jgi:molecular chaperone DnaK (HSP70)
LKDITFREGNSTKNGRILPSCVVLATTPINHNFTDVSHIIVLDTPMPLYASVGAPALQLLEDAHHINNNTCPYSAQQVSNALVTSLKRFLSSQSTRVSVIPIGYSEPIYIDPTQLVAVVLSAIHKASRDYLSQYAHRKHLQTPGTDYKQQSAHVVLGVPARFTHMERQKLVHAAQLAGFASNASCVIESTAAAMAYGMSLPVTTTSDNNNNNNNNNNKNKSILVFDMGGGTTDVTIAVDDPSASGENKSSSHQGTRSRSSLQVTVTEGITLGGDDLDEALLDIVVTKLRGVHTFSDYQRRDLRQQCQHAKEELCGNADLNTCPNTISHIVFQGENIVLSQDDLNAALKPWLQRAHQVVEKAVDKHGSDITEVILVGGSSRVPAVRAMLQSIFPRVELCFSVNPMRAVAEGAAIKAAVESKLVPLHELKSAMMLDTLPYAIGVLTSDNHFVQILAQYASLPAKGFATFHLASIEQPGITLQAVECIDDDNEDTIQIPSYQTIQEFTFLLHRLSMVQRDQMHGKRSVDVGMILRESGELVVSIFDPNDPEHIRKRRQLEGNDISINATSQGTLQYIAALQEYSKEQVFLVILCCFAFVFYVAVKILFPDERLFEWQVDQLDQSSSVS